MTNFAFAGCAMGVFQQEESELIRRFKQLVKAAQRRLEGYLCA